MWYNDRVPLILAILSAAGVITNMASLVEAKNAVEAGRPFRIAATLLSVPASHGQPFTAEADGIGLTFYDTLPSGREQFEVGDKVELSGFTKHGPTDPTKSYVNPDCSAARLISRGQPPAPICLGPHERLSEAHRLRLCTVRGILTDIAPDALDPNFFFLTVESGEIEHYVVCLAARCRMDDFMHLRGAEVAVTGVGGIQVTSQNQNDCGRRHVGWNVSINDRKALRVLRTEPEVAATVRDISATDMLSGTELSDLGLIRAEGTVIAVWKRNQLLLRTDDRRIIGIELAESSTPTCGERIETVGYAETDLLNISLVRATFRKIDRPADVPPVSEDILPIMADDLLSVKRGRVIVYPKHHGRIVRLEGLVRTLPHGDGSRMLLESDGKNIPVDLSACPEAAAELEIGSRVAVSGVCVLESENCRRHYSFPTIHGIFLVPREPADIVLLERPSWWTPARLLMVIAVLLGIVVAVLIWNFTLRILVERRGRQLFKAEVAKLSSELRIEERTRLAAELHDYLAQNLTAITYEVSSAERARLLGRPDVGAHLRNSARMLSSCQVELRRCLWDLRSDALNESDFAVAIRRSLEPLLGSATLTIRFAVPRKRVSDTTAHAIISIIRELASNAVKHGRATQVRIAGELLPDMLRFSVRDNGCGFDVNSRADSTQGHFGLDGIVERLRRHDGTLTLESSPGSGTRVVVTIKIKQTEAKHV